MVTRPEQRRTGGATAALATLASWAMAQGCRGLYLQVEDGNDAALDLYRRAGFELATRYHYRTSAPTT